MKNVFLALGLVFVMWFLAGCSKKIYVPVETKVTVKETVRDTIIDVQLEREYIKQVVPDTTSIVETKYAISTAIWHIRVAGHLRNACVHDLTDRIHLLDILRHLPAGLCHMSGIPLNIHITSPFQNR